MASYWLLFILIYFVYCDCCGLVVCYLVGLRCVMVVLCYGVLCCAADWLLLLVIAGCLSWVSWLVP